MILFAQIIVALAALGTVGGILAGLFITAVRQDWRAR